MYYLVSIFVVVLIDLGVTCTVSLMSNSYSLLYAIFAPILTVCYLLVLLGSLDLFLRIFPKKIYDYNNSYFRVGKKEVNFYKKIGIKQWKNKVPELGASGGFAKKNLNSLELNYLQRFIYETCFGEILHLLAGVLGFTALFFFELTNIILFYRFWL